MTNPQLTKKPSLSLKEACRDFGWLPSLFVTVVGAPSILSLAAALIKDFRLAVAFRWIVDGYLKSLDVMSSIANPAILQIGSLINKSFDPARHLHGHWRELFLLNIVVISSFLRSLWEAQQYKQLLGFGAIVGGGAMLGSLLAGTIPPDGGARNHDWVLTASAGSQALFFWLFYFGIKTIEWPTARAGRWFTAALVIGVVFIVMAVASGVWLGQPWLVSAPVSIGVLLFGILLFCAGVAMLAGGLWENDLAMTRVGITITGGFFLAASIFAINWFILSRS